MSYQESRAITYLFSTLIGAAIYSFYVVRRASDAGFDPSTIDSFWGIMTLIVIAVTVVISVILTVIVTVAQAVAERDDAPSLADERDRLFELKANQISFSVFGAGFVLAMIALAVGQAPLIMFHLIVYSLFGATAAGTIAQLTFYRRGY